MWSAIVANEPGNKITPVKKTHNNNNDNNNNNNNNNSDVLKVLKIPTKIDLSKTFRGGITAIQKTLCIYYNVKFATKNM